MELLLATLYRQKGVIFCHGREDSSAVSAAQREANRVSAFKGSGMHIKLACGTSFVTV